MKKGQLKMVFAPNTFMFLFSVSNFPKPVLFLVTFKSLDKERDF